MSQPSPPHTLQTLTPGRALLTLLALLQPFGAFTADFNHTHIYNPLWPPHAKFHTGQTMSLSLYLCLFSQYLLWRRSPFSFPSKTSEQNINFALDQLNIVLGLNAAYFVTQATAILFPEAAALDPPGDPRSMPQFWVIGPFLVGNALGWWVERRRLKGLLVGSGLKAE
ncbi:MAG: hypothetical protein M1820_009891 [Bogoriella megaspora]|nr:MAG: hypothetical protein M1820_009891 [Bogoriella megaspora]